jgi:hypothetical protein
VKSSWKCKGASMKDKIIIWKASMMKLPSLLVETILYIIISFLGIIINIIYLFGIQPRFNSDLTGIELIKTNEFIYGCLSTTTCIAASMLFFYFTNNKSRRLLPTVLVLIICLSVMFSTVSLSQSNPMIDDFFSVNFIFAGLLIIIGLLFVSVFIYKLDTEQAVHEFQIQQKANEYKQEKITEDVINGKRIKA